MIAYSSQRRAIIAITATKTNSSANYARRMYAIMRRYTPEVIEGAKNECFAELTGLRTFFKMTYQEMTKSIIRDLKKEIGGSFSVRIAQTHEFDAHGYASKKVSTVSTYQEINSLFAGKSFVSAYKRTSAKLAYRTKKVRLTIPFIGKVA